MLLLRVAGCFGVAEETGSADSVRDSAETGTESVRDSAESAAESTLVTETAVDTSRPADSGDSGAPVVGTLTWETEPTFTFEACGTDDDDELVLTLVSDLDGDGVGEVAVGLPRFDTEDIEDAGGVFFVSSSATGTVTVWDQPSSTGETLGVNTALGESTLRFTDQTGDGVDDLLVTAERHRYVVDVQAAWDATSPVPTAVGTALGDWEATLPWSDVDGDGANDWLVGLPDEDYYSSGEQRGSVGVVSGDPDTGTALWTDTLWGNEPYARAGARLFVSTEDIDGDGVVELYSTYGSDLVLFDTSALGVETFLDDAIRWRFPGMAEAAVTALGDVDGGGVGDTLFSDPTLGLCLARGEDGDVSATPLMCPAFGTFDDGALGPDADGDGDAELWTLGGDELVAWDLGDALGGVATELTRRAVGADVDGITADETQLWVEAAADDVPWLERAVAWRLSPTDPGGVESAEAVLWAGGYGGDAAAVIWADLDGDGEDELIARDRWVWVVSGARVRAGGAADACDADTRLWLDGDSVVRADDLDGDGAEDLLVWNADDDVQRAISGRSALAGVEDELFRRDDGTWFSDLACDFTGDGTDDLEADDSLYDPMVLMAGGSIEDARFATVSAPRGGVGACLPDSDGDGVPELAVADGWDTFVLSGAALTGGATLSSSDAIYTLLGVSGDENVEWLWSIGDVGDDGVADYRYGLWAVSTGTDYCYLDGAVLATATPTVYTDLPGPCGGTYYTAADGVGDARADLIWYDSRGFVATDLAGGAGTALLLADEDVPSLSYQMEFAEHSGDTAIDLMGLTGSARRSYQIYAGVR